MADGTTVNFGWIKPEVGGSSFTWGTKQNGVFDQIDAELYAVQLAGEAGQSPVGSIVMYAGPASRVPPPGWTLCAGQLLNTTDYPLLYTRIGYRYGGSGATFALPNMTDRFPCGAIDAANPGVAGGEANHTLTPDELPAHSHLIADPTHAHPIVQTPHGHVDPGHVHSISDPGHAHTGVVRSGGQFSLGVAGGTGLGPAGSTDGSGTGVTIQPAFANLQTAFANIAGNATNAAGTGITNTQNTGSGIPHNNIPPFIYFNFIIRIV